MTTVYKYSPINILKTDLTYTDKDNIPTSKDTWSTSTGLDPAGFDSVSDDYNACIENTVYITAYLEALGYPTDMSTLTGKFDGLTFQSGVEIAVNYAGNEYVTLMKYTVLAAGSGTPYSFSIITKFDQKIWVDKAVDYTSVVRGSSFFKDNSTNVTAITSVGSVVIGSGENCIPVFMIADKLKSNALSLVAMNPPAVFLDTNTTTPFYKKVTIYENSAWSYKYPVLTKFNQTDKNLLPFNLSTDPAYYFKRFLTFDYTPTNQGEYNSIYQFVENTINDKIINDCFNGLGLTVPTTLVIPTTIADRYVARKAYYAGEFDMDVSGITNYGAKYYDDANNIVAFTTSTDGYLFIAVTDESVTENPVMNQTATVNINYNTNVYTLLTECDINYTATIASMMTALSLDATFNKQFFVYGFGHCIHSFLRDLNSAFTSLDYAKGSLYIEALPSVTQGFTTFAGFPPANVIVNNLWQDEIVNNKTSYDGTLDDIMVNNLYDVKLTNVLEENAPCIHSVYAYDLLIPGTQSP